MAHNNSVAAPTVCRLGVGTVLLMTWIAWLSLSLSVSANAKTPSPNDLWKTDNLVAWEVMPFDSMRRSPEERAAMLQRLGFKHYAHLPLPQLMDKKNLEDYGHDVDAEIEALQAHGVDLLAWYLWIDFDDPAQEPRVKVTLESFKRHHIRPQLWVAQAFAWQSYSPDHNANFPRTPAQQQERIRKEARRIKAIVEYAAPFGCQVSLYNHGGWLGLMTNELAVLEQLTELGVRSVGLVYNFSHARDAIHDDSKHFESLWRRIQSHVVVVNITAVKFDDIYVEYPSQGNSELSMMRVIQRSGWNGPIGVIGQRPEDIEVALRNAQTGLAWLAAELTAPGSGGPRPFPRTPATDYALSQGEKPGLPALEQ